MCINGSWGMLGVGYTERKWMVLLAFTQNLVGFCVAVFTFSPNFLTIKDIR